MFVYKLDQKDIQRDKSVNAGSNARMGVIEFDASLWRATKVSDWFCKQQASHTVMK